MSRIYLSPPDIREEEKKLLMAAVESGWAAPVGPDLDAFEAELATTCGTQHAVAVNSGTAALHLALLLAGVQPGDDVLVPTLTFVATANAVVYCGARPCVIDSETRTWNMSPELLHDELQERRRNNTLPAAVVTVDLYGHCADYDAILPMCDELDIPVIEDAAEAIGATWQQRPAGSFGRFGVLSFNGNKLITTSGGGALLSDDDDAAERARYLATQARQPVAHYEHTEVGFNYRLSNLLAAFGRGQLGTLTERIERRRAIRQRYAEGLAFFTGAGLAPIEPRGEPNAWLTVITMERNTARSSPEELRRHLERHDIEARRAWKPIHRQSAYAAVAGRLDGTAEQIFRESLCLPSGSSMSDDDVDSVLAAIASGVTR